MVLVQSLENKVYKTRSLKVTSLFHESQVAALFASGFTCKGNEVITLSQIKSPTFLLWDVSK